MKLNLSKKIHLFSMFAVVLTVGLLLNSCKEKEEENKKIIPVEESGLPTVTTSPQFEAFALSANVSGEVTLTGKSDVTERGICWGKITKPTIANDKVNLGAGLGVFSGKMSGLEENTMYYIRAYATNNQGTAYGNEIKITTIKLADENTAPTQEMNRNAILEDFTGVRCGYCPDGHARAKVIEDANPGRFIIMAVHAGSYAAPASGWANFTTPFGSAIDGQSSVSGYPAGTINRIKAADLGQTPQKTNGLAMSRGSWGSAAAKIFVMPSPVNIGSTAIFNAATRELTVKVDLYYTGNELVQNNINVALLQNKLFSKQSGGTPDANNYEQNHVLRHLLTGQWGDVIPSGSTVKGSKYTKTFTYVVPDNYNGELIPPGGGKVVIENCEVVVFVSQNRTNILTGIEIPITIK